MRGGFWTMLLGSAAILAALLAALLGTSSRSPTAAWSDEPQAEPLVLYCAAGAKPPIEAAAKRFSAELGGEVRLEYGGSGSLLARIVAAPQGDLYLAADDSFLQQARDKHVVSEEFPLATQQCVIGVPRGNPKGITTLAQLLEAELRVGLATPDAAAVGQMSRQIAEAAGVWEALQSAVTERGVFKPTVNELANDLKLGTIDAALVWDSTVAVYPELDAVPLDHPANTPQGVTLCVLKCSRQPTAALQLARYIAARDRGLEEFQSRGYHVADGDRWTPRPEITIHCGGVLRAAVQQTIAEFAARENVEINTVYNGCGVLLGQMKAGDRSDGYFACDRSFMNQVGDLFLPPTDISRTRMVVCVPKDNPRQIAKLADLQRPGLKVGVCNERQSALGALSADMLKSLGMFDAVMKNVVSQVPTADMLVAQLRAGGLDAAIVYQANFWRHREALAAVEIDLPADAASDLAQDVPVPALLAVQPFAVGRQSDFPQLVGRLTKALQSDESQQRFVDSGFDWIADNASRTSP